MPMPSVEPSPPEREESRFVVPLDAQEASYFAASDRIAKRSFIDFFIIVHVMFLRAIGQSHRRALHLKSGIVEDATHGTQPDIIAERRCQHHPPVLPIFPFTTRKRGPCVKIDFLPHRTLGPDFALQIRLQG